MLKHGFCKQKESLKWKQPRIYSVSNMDTLGTKIFVLISEVSSFQGDNNMQLYKVGTRTSVLNNQVSLFQGCPLRGIPL